MDRRGPCRRVMLAASAAAAAWPRLVVAQPATRSVVEMGVVPHLSPRTLLDVYRPLREALQRRMRRDVQVSTAPGWAAFHQRTLDRSYDTVLTAANLGRLAQLDGGWRPLVALRPPIRALLVGPRQRAMPSGAGWRGARIGVANGLSLVAQRGLRWLAGQGLQAGVDFQTVEGSHEDTVAARVLRGDCSAALMSGGELRALPEPQRQALEVWQPLGEVPGFVALASPALPPAEQEALAQAWGSLDDGADDAREFYAASGFGGVEPAHKARPDPHVPCPGRRRRSGLG